MVESGFRNSGETQHRNGQEWGLERKLCHDLAHYFIFDSRVLLTKDEHDIDAPVKPFPDLPYLRVILDCLLLSGRLALPNQVKYAPDHLDQQQIDDLYISGILFIEKSRQLLVTWIVCAYLLWRAKYRPHQLILVQSKREDDADSLVYTKAPDVARISFMENHLPDQLRTLDFQKDTLTGKLFFDKDSLIWAIPEGGHIVRSNTPSVFFSDEAGFQPEFGHAFTAALPAVKGGGQMICVSSAEPGTFQQLMESI